MDTSLLYAVIGALSGVLVGGLATWFSIAQKIAQKDQELQQLNRQLAASDEKNIHLAQWKEEYDRLDQELRTQRDINREQEAELREVITRFEQNQLANEEKQRILQNSEQRLTAQFENLANRIFEQNERRASEQQQKSLLAMLSPFREQLEGFRQQVQQSFGEEAKERHTLAYEIRQLQQLNNQMTKEAVNLTRALKGDNKIQGNWGETILTRILEVSGLREGSEFETQVSINTSYNSRYQPDVIIHLPEGKDVVVDAKMSLVSYEHYFNSEDPHEQQQALKNHVASIRNHMRMLSRKDYHQLPGIRSLDYVLMFIPIEPAYLLALKEAPELLDEGIKQNIMLVCPSTLLVAVRTINNIWRYERQGQNAQEIANRAAKMYDKLRLFVDDMQVLGASLDKANNTYLSAMKRLAQGRGNLISQAESFKELGVEIKQPIAPQLVERSDTPNCAES
ncbi:DNA recombination protein RmuC [Providencia huaxiensis]|uniref:DNA recombination protein RmuC n=1 Tax=Providencia huaxiensis TaxID=2027290 RepID=A0ABU2ITB1_9GAMM|nr:MULTISPECIES: DNA recombination protein RmuC [Providencia]AXH62899.1 DNA recombination protein RmuC [Providencia huaxiensis]MBN6361767.1 DNA recombination protein RmuC [Providencia huaxiensis]MBQ0534780.1 DNA recombination protein RmuC [Providencia huaxiensis]MBQ0589309.1 DNA recombination protein RmuC [Providencia huaxiensis]MBZ3682462.1 DNA recombination protein RmuC [Providencia rettgeri]